MKCKMSLHQRTIFCLVLLSLHYFDVPIATSSPLASMITSFLPTIGDKIISSDSSIQVEVLKVEKIDSLKGNFDVTILPKQNSDIVLIELELKNLSHKESPTLILGPQSSTVQDIKKNQFPFEEMGVFLSDNSNVPAPEILRLSTSLDLRVSQILDAVLSNDLPIILPRGLTNYEIKEWLLKTDSTTGIPQIYTREWSLAHDASGKQRLISIPIGESIKLLLVYFVPRATSVITLSLPEFGSISLASTNKPMPSPASKPTNTILYFCSNESGRDILGEKCKKLLQSVAILYPKSKEKREYVHILTGDIDGNSYGFSLLLSSSKNTTFDVDIALRSGQKDKVLATTSFTATSSTSQQFVQTVTGIDPTTKQGDLLVLRISVKSGDMGYFNTKGNNTISFITIPLIR